MFNPFRLRVDPHTRLRTLYDVAASHWQQSLDRLGYPAAYADFMARALPDSLPEGGTVLDAGTGTGAFAFAYMTRAGRPGRLDLLDISLPMLEQSRLRLCAHARQIEIVQAPLGTPMLPASSYDTVLCAHVLEYMPDPASGIEWLTERIRPGGRLLLAVSRPHWCTALLRLRWGNASIRPEKVVALLVAAGLEEVTAFTFAVGPPSRTSCGYAARVPKGRRCR